MTPFASVALIKRAGKTVFRPPRKERPTDATQARKAAVRFWRGSLAEGDVLARVMLVREVAGRLEISEHVSDRGARPWTVYMKDIAAAAGEPHLAACMIELGIDAEATPPPVPDVLVINGFTYRREI